MSEPPPPAATENDTPESALPEPAAPKSTATKAGTTKAGTTKTAATKTAAAEPAVESADAVGWSALRKTGTLLGLLAVLWFATKLWAAYQELRSSGGGTLAVAQAANSLPAIMQSALLAGLGAGVLAVVTLERRAFVARPAGRLVPAAVAGLVIGGGAAGTLAATYGDMPQVGQLAGAVALAVVVGALVAAAPRRTAAPVAAVGGALACFVVGTILYSGRVVDAMLGMLGGGDTAGAAARVNANGYVSHIDAVLLGLVAGLAAYWLLRHRDKTAGTFAFLGAGAATGAMLLAAEPFIRIGGAALLHATRLISVADDAVISVLNSSRTVAAMLTLFVGALASMVAYGRSLPAKKASARVRPPAPRRDAPQR